MREYGGYLEIEHNDYGSYYPDMVALNTGRNCLRYLIEAKDIKHIYIPRFICEVIIDACKMENVEIDFYSIDERFMPKDIEIKDKDAYLYLINYYGLLDENAIRKLAEKYHIIVDNAQAFFQEPLEGIDTIYTCRKFFGVSDGAYLSTDVIVNRKLEKDISYDRMAYLFGRIDTCASEFYEKFQENEQELVNKEVLYMSNSTKAILSLVGYEAVKERRTENFRELDDLLFKYNKLRNMKRIIGPYMYPLLIENGEKLRRYLQKSRIYIPVLWPNVLETEPEESYEYYLAKNILPIPCDQRYDQDDMRYIATVIKKFMEVQE